MSLYATNIFENPAAQLDFEFNFAGGYLDANHIKVEAEDKTTGLRTSLPWRLLNNFTVLLTAACPANTRLWVYRSTPVDAPLADFTNGSRVTEANLDTATQQSIFAVAELYDRIALGLGGKGFTAATTEVTTEATEGQTVFPTPTYAATDTIVVTANQLRIHPVDVVRTASSTVTIPPQPAGVFVTVEVTRMLPIASAPVLPPGGSAYGQNLGAGAGVYKTTAGDALQFRTLVAGPNVTLTEGANTVTIEAAASGGGGLAPPVVNSLGNRLLDNSAPNARIEVASTSAGGWNTDVGMCTVDMEVVPTNYFSVNPGGHVAMVTRCDTALLTTAVSGQGAIFGNMVGVGGTEGAPWVQASQLETWEYPDTPSNRWVFPDTAGGPASKMIDGQRYRFIIDTSKWYDGKRYLRYRRYIRNVARACWDLEIDTGSVLDHNIASDLTKTGIALGHVFGSGSGGWSVSFENITVTWGAPALALDSRALLPKAGGDVTGAVTFKQGANLRLDASGMNPVAWAKAYPAAENDDCKLVAAPSKASGQALIGAFNGNTANVGYVALSALPTYAVLNTAALGTGATPELRVGYGTSVQMTYKATGVYVGASPAPLGNASIYANLQNAGGAQAVSFANSGSPFDIESVSTTGALHGFFSGSFTSAQATALENIIRPLYCLLSTLIATTRSKGTA